MPRDSNGNYTPPNSNPVVTGTIIESDWANQTVNDLATAMTGSLSRNGQGGMLAPLKHVNGSALLPAVTWANDVQSGLYLNGVGEVYMSVGTTPVMRWLSPSTVQVWNAVDMVWDNVGGGTVSPIFTGPNPTLGNLTAALFTTQSEPIGASDHIQYGYSAIQAVGAASDTNQLSLNALGGDLKLGAQSGSGDVLIYQDGALRASFNTGPFPVGFVLNESGGVNNIVFNDAANAVNQGSLGFLGLNFQIDNKKPNGLTTFTCTKTGGAPVTMLVMDEDGYSAGEVNYMPRLRLDRYWDGVSVANYGPALAFTGGPSTTTMDSDRIQSGSQFKLNPRGVDVAIGSQDVTKIGGVLLYDDGVLVGGTTGSGLSAIGPNPTLAGANAALTTGNANPQTQAHLALGYNTIQCKLNANVNLGVYLNPWGGPVHVGAFEVGQTGDVQLYKDAAVTAMTISPAAGGLQVNNTLTGTGMERVATQSDVEPANTTNYVAVTKTYVAKEGYRAYLNSLTKVELPVTGVYTVGLTGSGANFIFTNDADIPTNAKALWLKLQLRADAVADPKNIYIGVGSAALPEEFLLDVSFRAGDAGTSKESQIVTQVPLNAGGVFNLRMTTISGLPDNYYLDIQITGYSL